MTNKNKKGQGGRPSSYRAPAPAQAPRRGLLDSLFAPRVIGGSPMPKLRTSFARGTVTALSTPVLLAGVPIVVLIIWIGLLATGFQGPFTLLNAAFAPPPVGTLSDGALTGAVAGGSSTAVSIGAFLGFLVLRSLMMSFVATASVERMRTGAVSAWSVRRVTRVLPVAMAANLIGFTTVATGQIVLTFLGMGLGLLAYFGALVGGLYLTAFAPVIAADEDRPLPGTMQRAFRTARMPGASNLTLAALYAIPIYALLVVPLPGNEIGVNPSATAWLASVGINLLHVAVMATFAFRYLSVAPLVPEAPAPKPRRSR